MKTVAGDDPNPELLDEETTENLEKVRQTEVTEDMERCPLPERPTANKKSARRGERRKKSGMNEQRGVGELRLKGRN